jgi:hypothetical protein
MSSRHKKRLISPAERAARGVAEPPKPKPAEKQLKRALPKAKKRQAAEGAAAPVAKIDLKKLPLDWSKLPQEMWGIVAGEIANSTGTLAKAMPYRLINKSWDELVKALLKRRKQVTITLPIVYPKPAAGEEPPERDIVTPVDAFRRVSELCPNLRGLKLDCFDCFDPILTDRVMATIPTYFQNIVQLHICHFNEEYTDVGLTQLAKLPKIREMIMTSTKDTDSKGLAAMVTAWTDTLEVLIVYGMGDYVIHANATEAISRCKKLCVLGLQRCGLTRAGTEAIVDGCPKLMWVDFSSNKKAFKDQFTWREKPNLKMTMLDVGGECNLDYVQLQSIEKAFPNLQVLILGARDNLNVTDDEYEAFLKSMAETRPECDITFGWCGTIINTLPFTPIGDN